ncbi:MAG TPA: hypothetical protein DHV85_01180 [Candidatus Accumulibacter sp.]|nr:hypothetical protein [Accumulibacter sp.]
MPGSGTDVSAARRRALRRRRAEPWRNAACRANGRCPDDRARVGAGATVGVHADSGSGLGRARQALAVAAAAGDAATAPSDLGRWLLQLVVAAACTAPLGYLAAQVAFQRLFASADNHDTALPWLLAAPLAVVVFMLVSGFAFAVVALLLGLLLKEGASGRTYWRVASAG